MTITRDQFIRGFNAIQAHYAGRTLIEQAMFGAGWEDSRIGYDPVVIELRHQLEERCNDTVVEMGGTLIDYALNEGGECSDPATGLRLKVDSAVAAWTWWETTETGPFAPELVEKLQLQRYDLRASQGCECCGPFLDEDQSQQGEWVKFADVQDALLPEVSA